MITKPYVVTMFVDATNAISIDRIIGSIVGDCKLEDVYIKNWIIDEDEDPEAHT